MCPTFGGCLKTKQKRSGFVTALDCCSRLFLLPNFKFFLFLSSSSLAKNKHPKRLSVWETREVHKSNDKTGLVYKLSKLTHSCSRPLQLETCRVHFRFVFLYPTTTRTNNRPSLFFFSSGRTFLTWNDMIRHKMADFWRAHSACPLSACNSILLIKQEQQMPSTFP